MMNLLRVERYKLIRNKVLWMLIGLITAVSFFIILLFFLEDKGVLENIEGFIVTVEMDETDEDFVPIPMSGIEFFIESIYVASAGIIVLLISILGAFFIATENSTGTIKNTVSIGYSRHQIYTAKLAMFSFASVLLVLFMSIIIGVFGSIFFGIGELPAMSEAIQIGKILLIFTLYVISFAAIVMFFSMIVKGSGLAIIASFIFYLFLSLGLDYLSYRFTLFEGINHYSVYYKFTTISESVVSNTGLLELLMVPIITVLVFISIGMFVFKEKDIQ